MSHSLSNPHPYAIKTTSTGILSRSASNKSSSSSHNHYVPISPSPSSSPTRPSYNSNHKYSGSTDDIPRPLPIPPPPQQQQHQEDHSNPNLWSPEELAQNIPQVADFVNRYDISGRAFLRLDNGVLDAYGISHDNDQRTIILTASHRLRQTVRRLHRSAELSQDQQQQQDQAYLSSSSSISSTSSPASTINSSARKRKHHQHQSSTSSANGRVHGMVASFERERSGSFSSNSGVEDDDPSFFSLLSSSSSHSRSRSARNKGLQLGETSPERGQHSASPSSSMFGTPQPTILNANSSGRPLPSVPIHPSLLPHSDHDQNIDENENENENGSSSAEMTIEDIVGSLSKDNGGSASLIEAAKGRYRQDNAIAFPTTVAAPNVAQVTATTNSHIDDDIDDVFNPKRREASKPRKIRGAAAWEMMDSLELDVRRGGGSGGGGGGGGGFGYRETVKRIVSSVPAPASVVDKQGEGESEMSMEELLASEAGGKPRQEPEKGDEQGQIKVDVNGLEEVVAASDVYTTTATTTAAVSSPNTNTNTNEVDKVKDDKEHKHEHEQSGWDLGNVVSASRRPLFPSKNRKHDRSQMGGSEGVLSLSRLVEEDGVTAAATSASYNVRTGKGKSKRRSIEDLFFVGVDEGAENGNGKGGETVSGDNGGRVQKEGKAPPPSDVLATVAAAATSPSISVPVPLPVPLPLPSQEMEETKKLIDTLQKRLETIERRVEELMTETTGAAAPTTPVPPTGTNIGVRGKLRELLLTWTTPTTTATTPAATQRQSQPAGRLGKAAALVAMVLPAALSIPLFEFGRTRSGSGSGSSSGSSSTRSDGQPDTNHSPTNDDDAPKSTTKTNSRNPTTRNGGGAAHHAHRHHHQYRYTILILGIGVCAVVLRGVGMMVRKGRGGGGGGGANLRGFIAGLGLGGSGGGGGGGRR